MTKYDEAFLMVGAGEEVGEENSGHRSLDHGHMPWISNQAHHSPHRAENRE